MLKRFRNDERGVAAIEFALLFPIMLLLYFGVAELTVGMMANGRAAHVASVVGDLVTQMPSVKQQDMNDVFLVGSAIMKPFPTASLKMTVTSIQADSSGSPKLVWQCVKGSTCTKPTGTAPGFPSGLLGANEGMIQTDVEYTYTSPTRLTMPLPLTFKSKYYIKPRRSDAVLFAG
ncbi:MAG: TadE/TadG family type IV pilus assembly protein [Phenylobacterium sp.]